MSDVKKIKAFVQNVLGCGCSEEVFRIIEETPAEYKGVGYSRINVGNRLLVYVFRTDDEAFALEQMEEIIRAGLADRDRHSFNRFRLVYAMRRHEELRDIVEKAFGSLKTDDRTHIHVVDAGTADFGR
ncbi:hypothetical protein [Methanocella arvoryzae]|uniref:Uncharacterized protein n=1 Tax=Methanocella arvoryzae (strain DSM 22066 / NBRC 105507 / MRE50) TaxID=351160 RepID=Q0W1P0_METAR|nr:hypothetical protein [Methanocella arvoryzae]CAJ37703.1 hypothetical protein RCIX2656 [Methanocella arvoryzae MRE50]